MENFHIFTQYTHILSVIQNDLSWLNNLFMVNFQLISMSSYTKKNNRCVESLNIRVEVAKCGKYSQIHPVHSLLSVTKNDWSCLNNLFKVKFQLIRMSSYAKNKLQIWWVIQHQCRSRQMWKIFTNSPSTLTFCLLQKITNLAWTIYSW